MIPRRMLAAISSAGSALVPDTFVTSYANYSTGLAAVTDGQSFAAPIDTYRDGVWLRTAGLGVLTGVQPHDQSLTLVRPRVAAVAALPSTPLVDLDAVDALWGLSEVKNRASGAVAPGLNLLWMWNGTRIYSLAGGMSSTDAQTDSQGGTNASRLTYASAAIAATDASFNVTVPAGQWTFQFDATSNSGSQSWQIGTNNTSGLAAITVTTTKQTFSQSFTLTTATARTMMIMQGSYPSAAASAGDITIENVRLIPGGSAQVGVQDTSLRVGQFLRTLTSSFSGSVLVGAGASTMAVKQSTAFAATAWTLAFCANVSRPSATSALVYGAGATMTRTTYLGTQFTTNNGQTVDSISITNGATSDSAMKPAGTGWQVHVIRVQAGSIDYWVDGIQIESDTSTSAIPSSALVSLLGGMQNANSAQWNSEGSYSGAAFWNSALSSSDIADVTTKLLARLSARSITKQATKVIHLVEGDSISVGSGETGTAALGGYASRAHDMLTGSRPMYRSEAVFGATYSGNAGNSLLGRQTADLAIIAAYIAKGWTPVMTFLIGTNDAAIITTQAQAETYYANLVSYAATMRTAGAKVIVGTQIPYGSAAAAYSDTTQTVVGGTFNGNSYTGWRGYIRAMLLAGSSNFDGIADFGGDAAFSGTYAASSANFADVAHPNSLGHSIMAGILAPVLQTVVSSI